jgi:hypothetical protein
MNCINLKSKMTTIQLRCTFNGIIVINQENVRCFSFQYQPQKFDIKYQDHTLIIFKGDRYDTYKWSISDLQIESLEIQGPSIVQLYADTTNTAHIKLRNYVQLQVYTDLGEVRLDMDKSSFKSYRNTIRDLICQSKL